MSKQEAQLKAQLIELEAKNPNSSLDANKKGELEETLAREEAVCVERGT